MFKRYLGMLMVFVMIVALMTACTPAAQVPEEEPVKEPDETIADESAQGKVLNWNLGAEPKTIDPGLNGALDGGHVINNMFEGLMREEAGQYEPAIAESYTVSEDGVVYTFTLRDAHWSDGEIVTAYDFEYAWSRVLAPETNSEYAWIFDEVHIDSFRALDEKTFEVTLSLPSGYFIGMTAFYTFFPVREDAVVQGADGSWATSPEASIVNGPFKLAEYIPGEKLVLVKNEHYWRADQVKLDQINGYMIVEQSTALTAYEAGELDVIDHIIADEIPRLIAEDPNFYIEPADAIYYYSLNWNVVALSDVRVRQALSLSINREQLVDSLEAGLLPATAMVTPATIDDQGRVFAEVAGEFIPKDGSGMSRARELMAEAGYPDGEGFPVLEILYNTSEGHLNVAEMIQQMWETNLGIQVILTNQEWATYQESITNQNFEICRSGWIGDYSDPMTYLSVFTEVNTYNYSKWINKDYEALLKASIELEPKERFEKLYEAHQILIEDSAYIPLYYYVDSFLVREHVTGWENNTRSTWFFGFADIVK